MTFLLFGSCSFDILKIRNLKIEIKKHLDLLCKVWFNHGRAVYSIPACGTWSIPRYHVKLQLQTANTATATQLKIRLVHMFKILQ